MTAKTEPGRFGSRWRRSRRGGLLLDGILAIVLLGFAAFGLNALGVTLPEILHGISHFVTG
jgi:hypothetical protein